MAERGGELTGTVKPDQQWLVTGGPLAEVVGRQIAGSEEFCEGVGGVAGDEFDGENVGAFLHERAAEGRINLKESHSAGVAVRTKEPFGVVWRTGNNRAGNTTECR